MRRKEREGEREREGGRGIYLALKKVEGFNKDSPFLSP